LFDLIAELTELPGPTGHEDAVQDWLETRWRTFARETRRTRVNNVLALVGVPGRGWPSSPTPTRSASW
jgi:putative aminopeptidase FrvX